MQPMNKTTRRSGCPINFSLEVFGDTWSLLILRDIIYFGKSTYNEFLASDEHIAPNILATRLRQLQDKGLLVKKPHPLDKRKEIYELTEDGLDLIPILIELATWGAKHVDQKSLPHGWLKAVQARRDTIIPLVRGTVGSGGSIFVGDNSVAAQLGL
jgi:DNA-binding HxlR family transcriptional regulator